MNLCPWLGLMAMALVVLSSAPARAQGMATPDRIEAHAWWPRKGTPPRAEYLGPAACARCHSTQTATQAQTSMARTATRAEDSRVLRARENLHVRLSGYDYRIQTRGGRSTYSVSREGRSLSVPLGFAFGAGKVGQTYLYEHEQRFYESRVSYFDALGALDYTPARALAAPKDLEEAAGRQVDDAEARRCFGCHTAASTTEGAFDVARSMPGVTCEACHGPGARHVAAAAQGRLEEARLAISNPRPFDPAASVDFCGACHSTWWDVTLAGEKGIAALRSQPFRLQGSRCWGEGDHRITCTACHDPHQPLVKDGPAYDVRCASCHVAGPAKAGRTASPRTCSVGTRDCASCHMPKYAVPGMHFEFTDHQIRVVREKP